MSEEEVESAAEVQEVPRQRLQEADVDEADSDVDKGRNKAPHGRIRWTDGMKYSLAKLASKHKGFIKSDESMEKKWDKIMDKVKLNTTVFGHCLTMTASSLRKQFDRFFAETMKEAGIADDAVNLSGLPENASEYQILMFNMGKELWEKKRSMKAAKEKQQPEETEGFAVS
jgi:hypothetical protein